MTLAAIRAGSTDGAVSALIRPHDFDPRGRFIRRTDLPESVWRDYSNAFDAAFRQTLDAGRRSR